MNDQNDRATWDNVVHFIAQGAINISEGLAEVEADSPVHKAMKDFCRLLSEGKVKFVSPERQWEER